jgi:hypothetical protein
MTAPVAFAFADPARRTWLALSKDGARYHFVHPIEAGDFRVRDELRRVGELTCECEGGRFRGSCYVVAAAEAIEKPVERTWFDGPPGEVAEVFGR